MRCGAMHEQRDDESYSAGIGSFDEAFREMKIFKKNGGINGGLVLRSPDAWMKLERKRELAANIVPFLATLWKLE